MILHGLLKEMVIKFMHLDILWLKRYLKFVHFYDIARLIEGRKEVLGEGNVLSISEKRQMVENLYGSE